MANGPAYFAHSYGPWAVVTGASSGIGAELARQLAGRGCNLLLVARRLERLRQLAEELKHQHGVETDTLALDLARSDFLESLLDASDRRDVGLVVCNAGLGAKGLHHETARAQIESVLSVNCRAVPLMAGAFRPQLIARGPGGLCLTGPLAGAGGVTCCATDCARRGDVRALRGQPAAHGSRPTAPQPHRLGPSGTSGGFTMIPSRSPKQTRNCIPLVGSAEPSESVWRSLDAARRAAEAITLRPAPHEAFKGRVVGCDCRGKRRGKLPQRLGSFS